MSEWVSHPFPPVFDRYSRVLVLGTMPSPKSREYGFYYMHPQNRFWPVLARLLGVDETPADVKGRKQLALENHIALWDLLASCEIRGAEDSSIRRPAVNDISRVLQNADICTVFTTGKKAHSLYCRYCLPEGLPEPYPLPSTSAANQAHYPFERLLECYRVILQYL